MLMLPAPTARTSRGVSEILGGKAVRFAREEEFARCSSTASQVRCRHFGNLYGVPVYVEEAWPRGTRSTFQAGTHTETMRIQFADFKRLAKPTVIHFACPA
jgi:Ala-tRNA(Pro) deacylase